MTYIFLTQFANIYPEKHRFLVCDLSKYDNKAMDDEKWIVPLQNAKMIAHTDIGVCNYVADFQ